MDRTNVVRINFVIVLSIIAVVVVLLILIESNREENVIHQHEIKLYNVGDLIYFDPATNEPCNKDTFTGNNTCYKWHVIESKMDNGITLQLDHNLINTTKWSNNIDEQDPKYALEKLSEATKKWTRVQDLTYDYDTTIEDNNYGKLSCIEGACSINNTPLNGIFKARMITSEELVNIVKKESKKDNDLLNNWSKNTSSEKLFSFCNKEYKVGTLEEGKGNTKLSWLVENTEEFENTNSTGNKYDKDNYGYWTLTPTPDMQGAWVIDYADGFISLYVDTEEHYGIRPVITISKTKI